MLSLRTASCAAVLLSAGLGLHAAWIPLKAELAQWLLQRAWTAALAGDASARPWPWADTRPAARLRVPGLGVEQFVLEGHSGRNLAFGPVLVDGTWSGDDRVLSGHRDTHFRFLADLRIGDQIVLEGVGRREEYRVSAFDVVDSRSHELVIEPGMRRLSLVTCYPFDAAAPGGPLRYVVTALPAAETVTPRRRSAASG